MARRLRACHTALMGMPTARGGHVTVRSGARMGWIVALTGLLLALCVAACGGGSDSTPPPAPQSSGGEPSVSPTSKLARQGKKLYEADNCASCHTLDGSPGTGPTYKDLAGSTVALQDGSSVRADPAYLSRSITAPDDQTTRGFPSGVMANAIGGYGLDAKPKDVQALVAFIRSVG